MDVKSFVYGCVVTVILGLIVNAISPHVNKIPDKLLKVFKLRNQQKQKIHDNTVKYLIEHPIEETNIRIRNNSSLILGISLFSLSIFSVLYQDTGEGIKSFAELSEYFPNIFMFIYSLFSFSKFIKYFLMLSEIDQKRKKECKKRNIEIDLY